MRTKQSSIATAGRGRKSKASSHSTDEAPKESANSASRGIEETIEQERSRLMKAEAVLHCVAVALDDADRHEPDAPHYQAALTVARDLIAKSIDQLDSLRVRPLLDLPTQSPIQTGIRENTPKYLH